MNIRKPIQDDMEMIREWRNDPVSRWFTHNMKRIPYADHKSWFNKVMGSEERVILRIVTVDDIPIGYFRLDKRGNSPWELSWMIAPIKRGKGYDKDIVKLGTDFFNKTIPGKILVTKIRVTNERSKLAAAECFNFLGMGSSGLEVWKMDDSNQANA